MIEDSIISTCGISYAHGVMKDGPGGWSSDNCFPWMLIKDVRHRKYIKENPDMSGHAA